MKTNKAIEMSEELTSWLSKSVLTEEGVKEYPELVKSLTETYNEADIEPKPKPDKPKTKKQVIAAITELLGE